MSLDQITEKISKVFWIYILRKYYEKALCPMQWLYSTDPKAEFTVKSGPKYLQFVGLDTELCNLNWMFHLLRLRISPSILTYSRFGNSTQWQYICNLIVEIHVAIFCL